MKHKHPRTVQLDDKTYSQLKEKARQYAEKNNLKRKGRLERYLEHIARSKAVLFLEEGENTFISVVSQPHST